MDRLRAMAARARALRHDMADRERGGSEDRRVGVAAEGRRGTDGEYLQQLASEGQAAAEGVPAVEGHAASASAEAARGPSARDGRTRGGRVALDVFMQLLARATCRERGSGGSGSKEVEALVAACEVADAERRTTLDTARALVAGARASGATGVAGALHALSATRRDGALAWATGDAPTNNVPAAATPVPAKSPQGTRAAKRRAVEARRSGTNAAYAAAAPRLASEPAACCGACGVTLLRCADALSDGDVAFDVTFGGCNEVIASRADRCTAVAGERRELGVGEGAPPGWTFEVRPLTCPNCHVYVGMEVRTARMTAESEALREATLAGLLSQMFERSRAVSISAPKIGWLEGEEDDGDHLDDVGATSAHASRHEPPTITATSGASAALAAAAAADREAAAARRVAASASGSTAASEPRGGVGTDGGVGVGGSDGARGRRVGAGALESVPSSLRATRSRSFTGASAGGRFVVNQAYISARYVRMVAGARFEPLVASTPIACAACGTRVCFTDQLLCTNRRWSFAADAPVEHAVYCNSLVRGSVRVGRPYTRELAQGVFDMSNVSCTCGELIGYKFASTHIRGMNEDQVGRYGLVSRLVRVERDARCAVRAGLQGEAYELPPPPRGAPPKERGTLAGGAARLLQRFCSSADPRDGLGPSSPRPARP